MCRGTCTHLPLYLDLGGHRGEWFDADFVADARSKFVNKTFVAKKLVPQRLDLVTRFPKAMLWHTDGGWMAPDQYWDNLDWLAYVVDKSPMASHVVSCNSMGVGCCAHHGTGKQQDKCWEYGDAPSGGDGTLPLIVQDRLAAVGTWLKTNGEAIYGTRPWTGSLPTGMEGGSGVTFPDSANATFYTAGGALRLGLGLSRS